MAHNNTSSPGASTFGNSTSGNSSLFKNESLPRSRSTAGICDTDVSDGALAFKALFYILVIICSLVGNSCIVAVVLRNRRMRTPVNFFILNMAIGDLLITVFFMPRMLTRIFYGVEWQIDGLTGLILCKISPSMQELCSCLSVLWFMAISIDRFFAVVFPLKKIITKNVAYMMIAGIWFIAIAARFPSFYYLNLYYFRTNVYCTIVLKDNKLLEEVYYNFSFVIFYAVPLCIVVILYTAVILALKKRKRPGATSLTQQNNQLKRTHRILKMLVAVVINFSICWFLYFCIPVLLPYLDLQMACDLFFPRFFLSHLNCVFNPLVYLISIENYRHGVKNIFSCLCPKRFCINAVAPEDECSTSEIRNKTHGRSSVFVVDNETASNKYNTSTSPL
ncbi:neuropeptide FF receptor 2-like [Actinia tenebrosa]|uniref:Neuropeptide FF receptor 2-like n=1 Tax=Actinia tenebrosa TaxID=6105 RepID=A0A6P8IQ36_ACTTE|nr:neuropeptide FF receptor 2-like [Actinia tenebrosa]